MKKNLLACCLLMACTTVFAQNDELSTENAENTFSQNIYITGGLGSNVAWTKGEGANGFAGKIGVGSWFNDRSGLRLVFGVGKREFDQGITSGFFSLGADYTLSLLDLFDAYNDNDRFSFDFNAGLAYYRLRSGENRDRPEIHAGIGAGYNFAPHWGIFAAAAVSGMEFRRDGDKQVGVSADLTVGLRYSFGCHKGRAEVYEAMYDDVCGKVDFLNSEVERLNEEVNRLRQEVDQKNEAVPDGKVMIAPEHEEGSIDIFFEQYSSFLGEEQRAKIEAIGTWLKENDYSIKIVAFSDNLNNAEIDGKLREGRIQAIRSLLESTFGVDAKRITVINAEELGYKNVSGCNAKILFSRH